LPTRTSIILVPLASLAVACLSLKAAGLPPGKPVTALFSSTATFPPHSQAIDLTTDAAGAIYVTGSITEWERAAWESGSAISAKHQDGSGRAVPCFPGAPVLHDIFIAKLSPDGTGFAYLKFFGGQGDDQAAAIAVDPEGRALVAGYTDSPDFPGDSGIAPGKNVARDVFVLELSPDGSQIERTTLVGGDDNDEPHDIALDAGGAIYVAGQTLSPDFPMRNSLPRAPAAGGLLRSDNAAMSWVESNSGLVERRIRAVVPDPLRGSVVYAVTHAGIFRSSDAGGTWKPVGAALLPEVVLTVAVDPVEAATLYAGTENGIFKTIDGGLSWFSIQGNLPDEARHVTHVVIDPANPPAIYLGTNGGLFKTNDGGQSWSKISQLSAAVMVLALHPRNGSTLYVSQYAAGGCGFIAFPATLTLEKSTDGGATFQSILGDLSEAGNPFRPMVEGLAVNPLDSTNLYLATSQGLFRTTDGGAHWLPDNEGLPIIRAEGFEYVGEVRDVIIDPLNPARLYALLPSKPQATELAFVSDDAGSSWRAIDFGGDIRVTALAVDPRDSARVYAGTFEQPDSDGFAFKLAAGSRMLEYSTILGGGGSDKGLFVAAGENGEVYVGGETKSDDFPVSNAVQSGHAGEDDVFVARLAADGASLVFSTYLGGSRPDRLTGLALSRDGSVVLAGQTLSPDFPAVLGIRSRLSGPSDAFVARLSSGGASLAYSSFLGGIGEERATGVALGPNGEVYLNGATASPNFPVTEFGAGCGRFAFRSEVPFLTKLDAGATRIEQSLRLSDSWRDFAIPLGIAAGDANNAFLLIDGQTVFRRMESGDDDRFGSLHVAKLDLSGADPPLAAPCLVNAASLIAGPVAPGEIVSLYGNGMGPEQFLVAQPGADGRLPLELDGTRVLFDGEPGPIVHIQSNQISAVAPLSVAGNTSLLVEVERGGLTSAAVSWLAAEAHPGVFTTTYDGLGPAVYNEDWTLNSGRNPARPGGVISVFLTGGGMTGPPVDPAAFAALDAPLARLKLPVTASFDGIAATVEYAGTAPGKQHGVIQVNVRIPAGLRSITNARNFRMVISVGGPLTQAFSLDID
jgi:uncharacterized protein (TIGR03437 family)